MEDGGIFTIARADDNLYSHELEIEHFDLFYCNLDNFLWAFGIKFKDTSSTRDKYVFFNGVSIDGIVFGDKRYRDFHFADDKRFRIRKFPPQT